MNFENIYLKLPYVIQSVILNFKGYRISKSRFNKDFHKFYKNYLLNTDKVVDQKQLRKFCNKAVESNFWRLRFEKYKVDVHAENLIEEITKLPVLTKEEVVQSASDIKIKTLDEPIFRIKTSGSTGTPLFFYQTQSMENKQWAIWWRFRNYHGIQLNDWCAWFGGRSILNVKRARPPFWHYNYFNRQLMFSAHHLSKETVVFYFKKLKDSKIKWLHGYPSQISYFASLILSEKLGIIENINVISLGAENLLESQLQIITKVFNAKVIQHYGLSEGVANISQAKDGTMIPDNDFSMVEFIPNDHTENTYKIIGTNYNNLAFPLFRYDTGDIVTMQMDEKGNNKIVSIDGRNDDYITLPNEIKLGRLDHIFKNMTNILESQIYQSNLNTIVIRVVKGENFTIKDERQLIKEAKKRIGDNVEIKITYYDKLERKESGKLKFVISEINKT